MSWAAYATPSETTPGYLVHSSAAHQMTGLTQNTPPRGERERSRRVDADGGAAGWLAMTSQSPMFKRIKLSNGLGGMRVANAICSTLHHHDDHAQRFITRKGLSCAVTFVTLTLRALKALDRTAKVSHGAPF